ncbi:MAG: CDP-diacylglycerol--glycerol-3-phosphate 3-phosphatidyltransferase [Alphaproteobacteria bacterium]|nr:CDP-diacylglycerol--glycerol-3-phosphate 3-phosphatidyltransferase [Alphaproteobacteria bacterium]
MLATIPNLLTLARIGLIPIMMGAFYTQSIVGRWVAALAFIVACFTDFLDGYVARIWSQTTKIGQFLDPVADKLLVASTLLMLAGFGRISHFTLMPAIIILCREIMVSGLREFLSELKVNMPVTAFAKWKTAIQMLAISLLLLGDTPTFGNPFLWVGEGMLWVAAVMTLISGLDYLRAGIKHFS